MKKRKITLVSLGTSRREYPFLPGYFYCTSPGIHYINAALRDKGFETTIVNQVTDNLLEEELPGRIRESSPEIVLFNQFFTMRERVRTIVRELGDSYIYGIGGHDATFHAISIVNESDLMTATGGTDRRPVLLQPQSDGLQKYYTGIDFIWLGEAEHYIADFLQTVEKQQTPLLAYNLDNRVRDLDTLPVLRHDDYLSESSFIVTSRGCMKKGCDFCTTPLYYRDGWRGRSMGHVKEELYNIKNAGKRHLYIFDDNFFGLTDKSLARGVEIIGICRQLGLKCLLLSTVRQILRAEQLGLLEKISGTVTCVFLGVENLASTALHNLGKKTDCRENLSQSRQAIEALVRHGILPYLGYMNFQPGTTPEELKASAQFLYETNMEASYFHYLYNRLDILEGTPLFSKYKKTDVINTNNETGVITYEFNNKTVSDFWMTLNRIISQARQIDYLNNETANLIFSKKLLKTSYGEKYLSLKRRGNEINYKFFMETLLKIEKGDALGAFLEAKDHYDNETSNLSESYKSLITDIKRINECCMLKMPQD